MNLLIQNVWLCDPATGIDGRRDILIEDGLILAVEPHLAPPDGCPVLEAEGFTAFPGLTDIHCHFRDPGYPDKETIESGAAAALRGGVTTVVCMANTNPPVDNISTLQYILDKAGRLPIRLLQNSSMTVGLQGQTLVDTRAMLEAGACGFSDDGIPITSPKVMEQALLAVKETGSVLSVHEELPQLIFTPGVNRGEVSRRLGLGGASDLSEAALVERDLDIQRQVGGRLHFQHISTERSLALIRRAKEEGRDVTVEVTPQHLALTDRALLTAGTNAKLNPPLRSEENRQALLRGVADGTVDVIATDHAPHTGAEKARGMEGAPSGLTGLETSLAVCLETLVRPGLISRLRLAELMSCRGAALYGLHKAVSPGLAADLVLFDEAETWTVERFHSKASNSPFLGQRLTGRVKWTVCGGTAVRITD